MTEPTEPTLPVGWYDSDDGRRYWDGKRWLSPAAGPDDSAEPTAAPGRGRRTLLLTVVVSFLVVALAMGAVAVLSQQRARQAEVAVQSSAAAAAASADAATAAASASASRSAAAATASAVAELERIEDQLAAKVRANSDQDASMLASGPWQVVESGHLYYRFAEDGDYTCGQWDCLMVVVTTKDGCPNGVYVEASVLQGETVTGLASGVIGALEPKEQGRTVLEDVAGNGDTFRISKVNCT